MRKEGLIIAGVLVPFAVLVIVGFWPAPTPARPSASTPVLTPSAVSAPVEGAVLPAVLDAGAPLDPALEAPVRAVSKEVHACFVDNGMHLHGRIAVTIAFAPTRDGGFSGISVETPLVNPELTACLEDVFAELHFEPTGRERFEPTKYTFLFDAPR